MPIPPVAGTGRNTSAALIPTHIDRERPPTLSPEVMKELEGLALAIRDHAFDPKALRDFVTMVLCSGDALPGGPAGDAARAALNELIRPFPEPPTETPFKPTEKLPRVPLDLFRDVWRAALSDPHKMAWGDDRVGKALEGLGIEPSVESLRMQQTQRALRLLWRQEVSEPGPADASHRVEPPRLLLRLAATYCRAHPDVTHKDFLQPFRALAECRIPLFGCDADTAVFWDSLCKGLYSGLIPYERFRALVGICTRRFQPTADAPGDLTSGFYCYVVLNALFSPVALRLLEQGRETLDTLISLLGIDAWIQADRNPSRPKLPSRIAFLLSALCNRGALDLSAFQDAPMRATVARLLKDSSIDAEELKLASAMVACGLNVRELESALRGETGTQPLRDLRVPDLEELPDEIPPLRRIIRDTLEHLRRSLIRLKTVQDAMPPGGPEHVRCETMASAWDDAIVTLDKLMKPSMEHEGPAQIQECLQGLRDRLALTAYPADRRVHIAQIRG